MTAMFEPELQAMVDGARRDLPTRASRAYGAMWRSMSHKDAQMREAQAFLFAGLSRDERRAGIEWAMGKWSEPSDGQISRLDV